MAEYIAVNDSIGSVSCSKNGRRLCAGGFFRQAEWNTCDGRSTQWRFGRDSAAPEPSLVGRPWALLNRRMPAADHPPAALQAVRVLEWASQAPEGAQPMWRSSERQQPATARCRPSCFRARH